MIRELIKKHTATKIADRMNESVATICNWAVRGVPLDKALEFCRAVDFEVTPNKLYPDKYPHVDDGLPEDMRCACQNKAA